MGNFSRVQESSKNLRKFSIVFLIFCIMSKIQKFNLCFILKCWLPTSGNTYIFYYFKRNIKSPVFDLTRYHHLQPSGDYLHIDFYGKSRTIHAVRTPTHICFCRVKIVLTFQKKISTKHSNLIKSVIQCIGSMHYT